jgi:hypothetical protein
VGRRWERLLPLTGGITLYRNMVRISEGTRPLGKSGYRWKDNIKIDLKELWCVDWLRMLSNGRPV